MNGYSIDIPKVGWFRNLKKELFVAELELWDDVSNVIGRATVGWGTYGLLFATNSAEITTTSNKEITK